MGLTHAVRNDKHHAPKKGGNKGILRARREKRRAEAEARNAKTKPQRQAINNAIIALKEGQRVRWHT